MLKAERADELRPAPRATRRQASESIIFARTQGQGSSEEGEGAGAPRSRLLSSEAPELIKSPCLTNDALLTQGLPRAGATEREAEGGDFLVGREAGIFT